MSEQVVKIVFESNRKSDKSIEADPIRELYSTLISNENLPVSVFEFEHILLYKQALPEWLKPLADSMYDIFIKSATSTRSINGALIKELTLQKMRYETVNAEAKKNLGDTMRKFFGGGSKGEQ